MTKHFSILPSWLLVAAFACSAHSAERTKPTLYVSFTMDCERIRSECFAGGPDSWESSERAIAGYCDTLLKAGYPPTLFVVPETGVKHAEMLRGFDKRGVELGMHLHPQCFMDHQYTRFLGQYDATTQKSIVKQGVEMLTEAVGTQPRAFRPGNFSASDSTFSVLQELGFTHGSVSDPGRHVPEYHADWRGADWRPHWANQSDRLIPGNLNFFEAPLTTDPEKRHANGFPHELRIESGSFDKWHRPIIEQALSRMDAENAEFRVLSIFTHNYFDYSQPGVAQSRTIREYIRYLQSIGNRYEVVGATLADIRGSFEEQYPLPSSSKESQPE